jgi:hypothetical protein
VTSPAATLVIEALALAVARRSRALLIDADNDKERWVTLPEAVRSGQAFVVELAAEILAIDCDEPSRVGAVEQLAVALREDGEVPILLASGRPDHRHLFCRIGERNKREYYRARAKQEGLQVRSAIRPPLAPHRLGLSVALLNPTDPATALAALRPADTGDTQRRTRRPQPSRPLSDHLSGLLRTGDFRDGGYSSRSDGPRAEPHPVDATVRRGREDSPPAGAEA